MKGFIRKHRRHKRSTPSVMLVIPLAMGVMLSSCLTADEAKMIGQTIPSHSNNQPIFNSNTNVAQCGPFDVSKQQIMCTMQYDPVCVKHQAPNGQISYKTAGNACMACTTATAVSYTVGECNPNPPTQ